MRYRLYERRFEPRRSVRFFSSPKCLDRLWGPFSLLILSWRVKRPGRGVDHSPPPNARIMNERKHTSAVPTFLLVVYMENFAFNYEG